MLEFAEARERFLVFPMGDVASQKGRAAHGAGHGHPQEGGKEFLRTWVRFHAVSTAHPASEEVKSRPKEIEQLASKRCPVPFTSTALRRRKWDLSPFPGFCEVFEAVGARVALELHQRAFVQVESAERYERSVENSRSRTNHPTNLSV